MAGTRRGRWWAGIAIGAFCLCLAGVLLSFGCAGTRLDGTPGSAGYCTDGEERTFVVLLFAGLAIGVTEALLGALLLARRRLSSTRSARLGGRAL